MGDSSRLPDWAAILIAVLFTAALVIECVVCEIMTRRSMRKRQLKYPTHNIHRI
jgi:hypothetical protein